MTWITYKRDGKFYTKERRPYGCEPMTETELTYEQWCEVLRTGEFKEAANGLGKKAKRGSDAKPAKAKGGDLQQSEDASSDGQDEA